MKMVSVPMFESQEKTIEAFSKDSRTKTHRILTEDQYAKERLAQMAGVDSIMDIFRK